MNKKLSIFLVIIVLLIVITAVGIVVWKMQSSYVTPPTDEPTTVLDDSTSAIDQSLENLNIGDLDKEFQEIDSDLNNL